jgi:zinc protease
MHSATDVTSEIGLWKRVIDRDVTAFEHIVLRYQSAVAGVAFSILRDFTASQDVSQETFWTAWRDSSRLNDVSRLGPWLCGIARNLAREWQRRECQRLQDVSASTEIPAADNSDPVELTISAEEQSIVQSSLESIPENYREAIVLFYRQDQNIREVARALDISEDAAKQRLSRGRAMLKDRVAAVVEEVLHKSRPGRSFTASVIAGVTAASAAAQGGAVVAAPVTITGAAATSANVVAGTGAALGISGGLVGAAAGLGGAWVGTWLPQQLAPTQTERDMLKTAGRKMMIVSIAYTATLLALTLLFLMPNGWIAYVAGVVISTIAFTTYILIQSVRMSRRIREIRMQIRPEDDPNPSALRARWVDGNGRGNLRGRQYTSRRTLFGVPLIDIQVSAPVSGLPATRTTARGWIAIGDRARGILFASGGSAVGFIALGGMTVGVISLGGLSIGVFSLGGLAAGMFSFGGLAIGYDAMGGGAIGWHSAAAGGAVAYHAAFGGLAVARDFAVGGLAIAASANTPLAKETVDAMYSKHAMDWYIQHQGLAMLLTMAVAFIPVTLSLLLYSRKPVTAASSQTDPPQ